jgi:hypothetical protein
MKLFVFLTGTEKDLSNLTRMPCCGSGMFIPDPDFYSSRIPDPKTATKERGEKN